MTSNVKCKSCGGYLGSSNICWHNGIMLCNDCYAAIEGPQVFICNYCKQSLSTEEMCCDSTNGYMCFACYRYGEKKEEKTGGEKYDQGKNAWGIIPFECLDELSKIMTYGVKKYGKPSGWQLVENMEDRYFSALMRHISAYKQGEVFDAESNHRHLSHALCNIVFLLWKELQNER